MARFGGKRKRERPTPVQLDEARPARARAEGRAAVVSARTPAGERRPEASHGRAPAGGVQARGPPMRTVSGRMSANYGSPANDEWQTCAQTWASLAPAIERYRAARVWMPFYYDGACAAHLRALGFAHVVHEEGADFFERVCDAAFLDTVDVVIDNRARAPPPRAPTAAPFGLRHAAPSPPHCLTRAAGALGSAPVQRPTPTARPRRR